MDVGAVVTSDAVELLLASCSVIAAESELLVASVEGDTLSFPCLRGEEKGRRNAFKLNRFFARGAGSDVASGEFGVGDDPVAVGTEASSASFAASTRESCDGDSSSVMMMAARTL